MKKKDLQALRDMEIKKLQAEVAKIHDDIAKEKMQMRMASAKDTNIVSNLKKKLAVVLTVIKEKELQTN